MEELAALYQKEGMGLGFLGKTHVQDGFCMFLCSVCREEHMDRALSEYVWRRLKYWAMGHRVTAASREELEQLLIQIQKELEDYGHTPNARGAGVISWKYLTLFLRTGDLAIVITKGTGRAMACRSSWGKCVVETLIKDGEGKAGLVRLQPRVGVLLLGQLMTEAGYWQQALDPMEIQTQEGLWKRMKELGKYLPLENGSLAYMIYEGE